MFHILIDTSTWLDLAQDQKQGALLDSLEVMTKDKLVTLIVPRIVITEFEKNRGKVAERSRQSLSSHFKLVKDAIRKVEGNEEQKNMMIAYLSDMDHRVPLEGGIAETNLVRIEKLLHAGTQVETTDALKARAAERALERKAPCHQDKNAMADAILVETYLEQIRTVKGRERFAFVTHNKKDFSDMDGDHRNPHPDLAGTFSKIKSLYYITLGDCLRRIDPEMVDQAIWEYNYDEPMRGLSEIVGALDLLADQVWYNRHMNWVLEVEHGKHKIVSDKEWQKEFEKNGYKHSQKITPESVWDGARRAAQAKEVELGKENLGPWSDFEWGMINGKLSALRWALGEDWDMLDT